MVWPKQEENIYQIRRRALLPTHPQHSFLIKFEEHKVVSNSSVYLLPEGQTFESDTVEVFFLSVKTTPPQNSNIYRNLPK